MKKVPNMRTKTPFLFCIQCRDLDSDTIGDFIYHENKPFFAVSPVFSNLSDLFTYMRGKNYSTAYNVVLYTDGAEISFGMNDGILTDFSIYDVSES